MAHTTDNRLADLEALYRERFTAFTHVASAIAGGPEDGADAVQEAFASAVRSLRSFRDESSIEAWVWPIVLNAARRRANAARRRPVPEAEREGHDPDHGELRQLVSQLPERQRQVLFLRYYADLEYGEIAAALGISGGTVGATLHQAHESLRRRFEEART